MAQFHHPVFFLKSNKNMMLEIITWYVYHTTYCLESPSKTRSSSQALKADFDAEALSLPGTDPAPINKWVDSKTQGLNLGQNSEQQGGKKNTCGWLVGWLLNWKQLSVDLKWFVI